MKLLLKYIINLNFVGGSNVKELSLMGATKNTRFHSIKRKKYNDLIDKTGAWASWWSYRIRPPAYQDKFEEILRKNGSFKLFWYEHGAIFWKCNVVDFVQAKNGCLIKSPWPKHTLPEWRNRYRIDGSTTQDQEFRLWFLINENKPVKPVKKSSDFIFLDKHEPWEEYDGKYFNGRQIKKGFAVCYEKRGL